MTDESTERSPQSHLGPFPKATRIRTAFGRAIKAAVPSGKREDIRALFLNRVSWPAIDHWRKGRRGPPQWAIDCVAARGLAIMDPLSEVKAGPGIQAGKYNLPSIKEKARQTERA